MPRKKPFSSKQKKQQLKERKQRKQASGPRYGRDSPTSDGSDGEHETGMEHSTDAGPILVDSIKPQVDVDELNTVLKVNTQPASLIQGRYDPNKYRLHFFKDDKEGLERRRKKARRPYVPLPQECLEMELDIYPDSLIDIPKRPPWDYNLTKHQLELNEERYFRRYLDGILSAHHSDELSYIELNLETWRQLWRVLEISDVFLIITDIRHPAMHFPPALYKYITEDLKKSVIIILNKVDLAPPSLVVAWQHYFKQQFPLVDVVCFSSFPKSKEEMEQMTNKVGKVVFKRRRRGTFRALGPKELHRVCEAIVKSEVDLSSWKSKIEIDQGIATIASDDDDDDDDHRSEDVSIIRSEHMYEEHEKYKDGVLTIGCVGYPNVGKSSVINGLMGKKVVSVSRTPGHTKHFQTIYLTPTVKLCDCPGLVFPSKVDRNLQILGGIYPIAQVREPYSTICYLAERLDLPSILRVKPYDDDVGVRPYQWSAMDICESWADKRGFVTAKAARLDTYRSANNLLRMALDGRLCLCLYPKRYVNNKDLWESHGDTAAFIDLQNMYTQKIQASADSAGETAESSTSEAEAEQKNSEDSSKGRQSETFVSTNPFALLGEDD